MQPQTQTEISKECESDKKSAIGTAQKVEEVLKDKPSAKPYALGEGFDLHSEIENGNISAAAGEFIREWPVIEDTLRSLYEFDAYSYIHTVQMLNEGCRIVDEKFSEVMDAVKAEMPDKMDERFSFTETDLKNIFLGAIAFHDWGKTTVNEDVLNFPGKLTSAMFNEMKKHPMGTVDIAVSEIIDKLYPDVRIRELTQKNKVLREANNEAGGVLAEIDGIISKASRDNDIQEDLKTFAEEVKVSINAISEVNSNAERLMPAVQVVIDAISAEDYDLAREKRGDVEVIVNEIREANRGPMEEVQSKIKEPVNEILTGGGHPKEKLLLQMLYLAASHHGMKRYPSTDDIGGVLPDYEKWLESSGGEQAKILAMLDVTDALRSVRSYRGAMKQDMAQKILSWDFLCGKGSKEEDPVLAQKYKHILESIWNLWEKMKNSDEYTESRKAREAVRDVV